MRLHVKFFLFSLLFSIAATPLWADGNDAVSSKGTIRGRIIDNAKQTLPGASIYIENLHTGVTSDVNGFYTFPNLNPGTYKVKVSYIGYSPVEMTITIPKGETVEKDVIMNEGLELQEVVVSGAFTGQRRALSAQKNNLGITNIVSADQVGKFPDSNIGDALKRISGINVQYDQGEARFGQVRGTSADMSSVTINGNRIPSAEGETRNVQLDLIPADMIQTIEVNKVVTPDMDADAIGGSINLVTKNSPYKRFISATVGSGYNFVADKLNLNLGFTYGDRFFNDKLGVMLSASYQNNPAGSDAHPFSEAPCQIICIRICKVRTMRSILDDFNPMPVAHAGKGAIISDEPIVSAESHDRDSLQIPFTEYRPHILWIYVIEPQPVPCFLIWSQNSLTGI